VTDTATYACNTVEQYADVRINSNNVFRLFGPSYCTRAAAASTALNEAFQAGDDFEFCTPSWYDASHSYAVVTVKSAKASNRATWYAHDKRLIVAATADEGSAPWYNALSWAEIIRDVITQHVTKLYLPPNQGTVNDGSAYSNKKGSNYGCGEALNEYTANREFFHCCDSTVAVNVWTVPDYASRWVKVTYPEKGTVAVLRVNDYGPATYTGRNIDLTCRSSSLTLGTYATDHPITFQFQK
jgi:hypothetical protein